MSFTMQNYNKYFNVASDINIFLIIVYSILKIDTYCFFLRGRGLLTGSASDLAASICSDINGS